MDKAALFHEVTLRNALRRTAQMPLLDVRREFDKAVTLAAMRAYDEVRLRYKADEERILDTVWEEFRERHGVSRGGSGFGRLAVYHEVDRRMTAFLSARGFARPYLSMAGTVYGSGRRVEEGEPDP